MRKRVDELRAQIAEADMTDPFVQADVRRWQTELKRLLDPRGTETAVPQGPRSSSVPSPAIRSNPDAEALSQAQRQWVPALRACERELQSRVKIRGTRDERRLMSPRDAVQAIELYKVLIARMNAVLGAQSIPAFVEAQRRVVEYRDGNAVLRAVTLPYPLPKLQPSGPGPSDSGSGGKVKEHKAQRPSLGRPLLTAGGAHGEGFAAYNRLADLGRGRSFEESLAMRQSSKRERRKFVDRIDRISASGSGEEYEDLE